MFYKTNLVFFVFDISLQVNRSLLTIAFRDVWMDWKKPNLVPRAFPLKVGGPGNEVGKNRNFFFLHIRHD